MALTGGFSDEPIDQRGLESLNQLLALQGAPNPDIPVPASSYALMEQFGAGYTARQLAKLATRDPRMLRIKELVPRYALRDEPVLITGPTGVGKETMARALHGERTGKFVPVNCCSYNKELVHSIFFGYRKGAFTGAIEARRGMLVEAANGTIFLDEIGDLPLDLQGMLLRAIQENEIYPIGELNPVKISCRFVAATKYDIEQMVAEGKFRDDLYARLSTFRIIISGLAARPDDIPVVCESLKGWKELTELYSPEALDIRARPDVMEDVAKMNVRALQRFIVRMSVTGAYHPDGHDSIEQE